LNLDVLTVVLYYAVMCYVSYIRFCYINYIYIIFVLL